MTVGVDDELRIREYAGDNSATPRQVDFKFFDNDDLRVTRTNADGTETVLVRGTHYSVSGAGTLNGGLVTPLSPILNGTSWRIEGDIGLGQPTDYTGGDDFPAESHERALDRSMIAHQEVRRDLEDLRARGVLVPRGEDAPRFASLVDANGKVLAVSTGPGGAVQIVPIENDLATAVDAAARAENAADDAAGASDASTEAKEGAEDAAIASENARDQAIAAIIGGGSFYPEEARDDVPRGAVGHGAITPGAGGANGTFALAFTAGNFAVNPTGTFTVAGGALTTITLTGPGLYIGDAPVAPTLSFAASAGLIGAAAALTVGFLVGGGKFYYTPSEDEGFVSQYQNVDNAAVQIVERFDPLSVGKAREWYEQARDTIDYLYRPQLAGRPVDPVDGIEASNGVYVYGAPETTLGFWETFTVFGAGGTGTIRPAVYTRAGVTNTKKAVGPALAVDGPGLHTLTLDPSDLPLEPGDYRGFYSDTTDLFTYTEEPVDDGGWFFTGLDGASFDAAAPFTGNARLQVQIGVKRLDFREKLEQLEGRDLFVVYDGNSLMADGVLGQTSRAIQLAALTGLAGSNVAVSGQQIDQPVGGMNNRYPTVVKPHLQDPTKAPILFVGGEPYNELRSGTSIAAALAFVRDYCELAREDAGGRVFIVVEELGDHNTATDDPTEGNWTRGVTHLEYNEALREVWFEFADALIETSQCRAFQDYTDPTWTLPDGVHRTTAANALWAQMMRQAIAPFAHRFPGAGA